MQSFQTGRLTTGISNHVCLLFRALSGALKRFGNVSLSIKLALQELLLRHSCEFL